MSYRNQMDSGRLNRFLEDLDDLSGRTKSIHATVRSLRVTGKPCNRWPTIPAADIDPGKRRRLYRTVQNASPEGMNSIGTLGTNVFSHFAHSFIPDSSEGT